MGGNRSSCYHVYKIVVQEEGEYSFPTGSLRKKGQTGDKSQRS